MSIPSIARLAIDKTHSKLVTDQSIKVADILDAVLALFEQRGGRYLKKYLKPWENIREAESPTCLKDSCAELELFISRLLTVAPNTLLPKAKLKSALIILHTDEAWSFEHRNISDSADTIVTIVRNGLDKLKQIAQCSSAYDRIARKESMCSVLDAYAVRVCGGGLWIFACMDLCMQCGSLHCCRFKCGESQTLHTPTASASYAHRFLARRRVRITWMHLTDCWSR